MRYIRFIVSVLLVCFVSGLPVWGKPATLALDRQVEKQVGRAVAVSLAQSRTTSRQQQIVAALDKVRGTWDDLDDIDVQSWEEFKAENESLTQLYQERENLFSQLSQELEDTFVHAFANGEEDDWKDRMEGLYSVQYKRPDYGKETKGVPFIYLTDASGHGTQSIVQEVQEVMRSVRAANPQARVLLATEFANMTDWSSPIQFAGKTNPDMEFLRDYTALGPQANQLGIDILALDDNFFFTHKGKYSVYKIGNRLVFFSGLFRDMTKEQWAQFQGFAETSTLGVKLRNEQWTSSIRAVKPFYDIIIVYAGNGHIDSGMVSEWNVPIQVGKKHVIFDFYTLERNKESDAYRDDTAQMLRESHARVEEPEKKSQPEPEPELYGAPWAQVSSREKTPSYTHMYRAPWAVAQPRKGIIEDWDGKSVFYEKTNMQLKKQSVQLMLPEEQQKVTAIMDKFREAGFKDIAPEVLFEVRLPDVTQK